ncbi:MAG: AI-2E family transporter [Butyrivibrio sp.]|uniref:AI-2E family transporter n=1 Tax=Butyrivibrio sp. TaxID=28121 RepID=UPI0025B84680|nr:AI-2E family transporter [Butyrivibrio sp.]MBQ6415218.1 AI-2E family transporter [Butyrivibrio sp.]MBQ6588321.1 AI-2E family transporter [Butyrivibrio sp.]
MKFFKHLTKKKWFSYSIATCSAVILYMIMSNFSNIAQGFSSLYGYIKPVVSGLIVAYVFNPLSKVFNDKVFKKMKNETAKWRLSVVCSLVVLIVAVVLLFVALIPQLVDSVSTFASNVDGYVATTQGILRDLEKNDTTGIFSGELGALATMGDKILDKIGEYFSNNVGNVVTTSANIGKGIFDAVMAFILAIYLLLDKARLKSGFARFTGLIMKPEAHKNAAIFFQRCNTIIIRYISMDIVEGIIVGVINLIFMLVGGIPYAVLISVIVGVTNLAPTFGPIIGCVIGAFILVLIQPWYALAFIIFTIVLQTVDGYILKPRLFGESLGVSPLMILIAIVIGGRLFGVAGILLAIPFAAIIDFIWRDYVLKKLEERHSKVYHS